jgi:hypothetical protein
MLSREAANANFIVICSTRLGLNPMIYTLETSTLIKSHDLTMYISQSPITHTKIVETQQAQLYIMTNNPIKYEGIRSYCLGGVAFTRSCYVYNSQSPIAHTKIVESQQDRLHIMTNNLTKYEGIKSYCFRGVAFTRSCYVYNCQSPTTLTTIVESKWRHSRLIYMSWLTIMNKSYHSFRGVVFTKYHRLKPLEVNIFSHLQI